MYRLVNLCSTLIILFASLVVILRILSKSGVNFKSNRFSATVLLEKYQHSGFCPTKKELAAVFGIALLFRAIVFVLSAFAIFLVNNKEFSLNELLNTYMQWDAHHYYRIAKGGYSYYVENGKYITLVFFPLYSWLIRVLNLFVHNYTASGIILSSALYSAACVFMYKLFALDYNKNTAIRAIVYISVFPHSLFFGVMMTESLLLFTSTVTFYYIRKHDWKKVGIWGALTALSRMAGLLMAIPAAVEWIEHYRIFEKIKNKEFNKVFRLFFTKGIWIFLMLAGTGIYLLCNYMVSGEWFKFLEYQKDIWDHHMISFGKNVSLILSYVTDAKTLMLFAIHLPQILSIAFIIATVLYGLRTSKNLYTAFLIVYLLFNMSVDWPISLPRYMTCAIPAFAILSDFSEKHKWTEHLITPLMSIAFGIFFTAYFMSKNIM